jgi:DNA-binding NtrC family response regulator
VLPIRIPPLRLRRGDIPSLVQYFVERKAKEMNISHTPQIESHAIERLKAYDWPGNVRELQNIVERALILSRGSRLEFPELGVGPQIQEGDRNVRQARTLVTMNQAIANHIRLTLEHTGWKVEGSDGAAKLLQMNPSTLRFRMKKLGIHKRKSVLAKYEP